MATTIVSKPSKWLFACKNLLKIISFPCLTPSTPGDTTAPLKDVFDHLDIDKDGKISSKELMDYFELVGEPVRQSMAKRVINEFDTDGDELLDLGDFGRLVKQEDNDELEDVLRSAFEMFEVEKGCGCITPKGLQQMLRRLGDVKSHDECAAMIGAFDLDGNGFLDFHEFQHMMSLPT
ncbi:hypothetical protein RJT34_08670 [Clitoria ternatea]|uniref:EF-hand domain-containing protein n=1 Tax=Clitoria ternatea TaxID=43366 RepID=A0AAN9K4W7_CLITE